MIKIINRSGLSLPKSTRAHPRSNPSMSMNMQRKLEMASQLISIPLEFMKIGRGCVREIFKVSYASWFSLYMLL